MKPAPTIHWTKKRDPIDRALDNAEWRKFVATLRIFNALCQRIVDGVQCMHPGKIGHHLVGRHTDPSRMCDPSNVVMVCSAHHPAGIDGEPADSRNEYAPTRWRVGFGPIQEFPH